jgi:HEAT repeat protein
MLNTRLFTVCAVLLSMAAVAMAADTKTTDEKKLIAVLQSDSPPAEKAITCKRLAVFGSKEAVPALAPLLADKDLTSWARIALEVIPGPEADAALREAMPKVQGRILIGVINSIAVRRDAKAVDALIARIKDADADVASAAAVALGRIAGETAAQALEQSLAGAPAGLRGAIAQGCDLCAEKYLAEGKKAEAIKLYDLVRKADVPKNRVLEATRGAILARETAGLPLLVEQLKSKDKALFGIGLRVARELPGREVTDALLAELAAATPERQILLGLALADRGDPAALPAVLAAAKSGPESQRIVAVGMLKKLGNASCVPVLLEAALEANADLSRAGIDVLGDLAGKDVDEQICATLAKAEGKAKPVLIQLAGQRRIAAAVPTLLKAAEDADVQIRCAALAALGQTIDADGLTVLIARVAKPSEKAEEAKAAEEALRTACTRMADREACAEKLIAAMSEKPTAVKCKFLEVLGAMGGAKALAAIGAAIKDATPEIQDTGTRVLGEWMSADAAPALLELAKSDSQYKTRALRGYLRIARQLKLPKEQSMAMGREAWKLCERADEKKLVLDVFRRNPSTESLSLVVPHLRNPALKKDAAEAVVTIAKALAAKEPAAVAEALKQVIEGGGDAKTIGAAKALLEQAQKAAGNK